MNLSKLFIQRPVMTTLVMTAVLFFGILTYSKLPVSDLPSVDYPSISVSVSYPGADPETMASTVALPLEKQFMQISGINDVISTSNTGKTSIVLQFSLDKDLTAASVDVSAAIARAMPNLPSDLPYAPTYETYNPSNSPIMYLAITNDTMKMTDVYDYANTVIAQRIAIISGVSKVDVYGPKFVIRAKVGPEELAARNIGFDEIAGSIKSASQKQPSGQVYGDYIVADVLPQGQLVEAEGYRPIIVDYDKGNFVKLKDIAEVYDSSGYEQLVCDYWTKDTGFEPSVVIAVNKQPGTNTLDIASNIKAALEEMKVSLPGTIKIYDMYDRSNIILDSVREVQFTLILAFILVVLVIFLFLGNLSTTVIPAIALPLSIIGTFIFMYLNGYSMDILSLLSLTLVMGFLADDAIVVLENIYRYMEMGDSPIEAAIKGSKQISFTVLSMTLCLAVIFLPLLFMPGLIGRMLHEFSWTIVIAVLFSGFISLTLTPMLCSRFFRAGRNKTALERFADAVFSKCLGLYTPLLKWFLHHRMVALGSFFLSVLLTVYLFLIMPQDFIPGGDTGVVEGLIINPDEASPYAVQDNQIEAADRLVQNPYIEQLASFAVGGNMGYLIAILKPGDERPGIDEIANELNYSFVSFANSPVFFKALPMINLNVGTQVSRGNYVYTMKTIDNPENLYDASDKMLAAMRSDPMFRQPTSNLENHSIKLKLNILRDRAGSMGISVEDIENVLNLAFADGQLLTFTTSRDQYKVIMSVKDKDRVNSFDLSKLYVSSNLNGTKKMVPLDTLVEVEETLGPLAVNHDNQFASVDLSFNLAPHVALAQATTKVEELAHEILPDTVTGRFEGTTQAFEETMHSIIVLLLIGIIVIYMILGILYESFIVPITILSALPGAGIGALLTLLLFQMPISLYGYVGMIMLIGIVMKNGIMLVEFATENISEGKSVIDSIVVACKERFRPIIMTTLAAMMGAVPIALGVGSAAANSRRSLGLTIIGGLIFSQLITFIVTPVVYYYLENFEQWMKKRKKSQ